MRYFHIHKLDVLLYISKKWKALKHLLLLTLFFFRYHYWSLTDVYAGSWVSAFLNVQSLKKPKNLDSTVYTKIEIWFFSPLFISVDRPKYFWLKRIQKWQLKLNTDTSKKPDRQTDRQRDAAKNAWVLHEIANTHTEREWLKNTERG